MSKGKTIAFFGGQYRTITDYAATKNITSVTNAQNAVIGVTGHGLDDNDLVKVAGVVGPDGLNDHIFAVSVLTADTLELVGADTLNADVYVSGGTIAKATMSSSCQITSDTHDDGANTVITSGTNCGPSDPQLEAGTFGTFSLNFNDAKEDFIAALKAAKRSKDETAVTLTLPKNAGLRVFVGKVENFTSEASFGGVRTGSLNMALSQYALDLEI
jgi:hypothetical protein